MDPRVAYVMRIRGGTLFVTRAGEMVCAVPGKGNGGLQVFTETLVGDRSGASLPPEGHDRSVTEVGSFIGDDPRRWKGSIRTYRRLDLGEAFPGVKVILQASGGEVEKIFQVSPGGDPAGIRLKVDGSLSLAVTGTGALRASGELGELEFSPPVAFQVCEGRREAVEVAYAVSGAEYGFRVGPYDRSRELVIDPLTQVIQSTFAGGNGDDFGREVAVHPSSGDVYFCGYAYSTNFPGVSGGAQASKPSGGAVYTAFVMRLNASLTTVHQATYFGGTGSDQAFSVTVNPSSYEVYVGGHTASTDLANVSGSAQPSRAGGTDSFVARFNAALTSNLSTTYLGGAGNDLGYSLGFHPLSGSLYVSGYTLSTDFHQASGGAQASYAGGSGSGGDAFVALFNTSLTSNIQSTYFGGGAAEQSFGLTFNDLTGDVYVSGSTSSTDLPQRTGGAQSSLSGTTDAFVARMNATLTSCLQSTYLGGASTDTGFYLLPNSITSDIYLAGTTSSSDFPNRTGGAHTSNAGGQDSFLARFNPSLTSNVQSTYFGGSGSDYAYPLAVHPRTGDLYLSGYTSSTNLPQTAGGAQAAFASGSNDGFIGQFNATLTSNIQTTYFGGSGSTDNDQCYGLVLHPVSGDLYLGGYSSATTLPSITGGAQTSHGGGDYDAVLVRFLGEPISFPPAPAAREGGAGLVGDVAGGRFGIPPYAGIGSCFLSVARRR